MVTQRIVGPSLLYNGPATGCDEDEAAFDDRRRKTATAPAPTPEKKKPRQMKRG
jgi:hypothetical protein